VKQKNASSNQQTTEARLAKSPQVLYSFKAWTAKIPQKGPLQEKIIHFSMVFDLNLRRLVMKSHFFCKNMPFFVKIHLFVFF